MKRAFCLEPCRLLPRELIGESLDQEVEVARHDVALGVTPPDFVIDKAVTQLNQILILNIEERVQGSTDAPMRVINERFLDRGGYLDALDAPTTLPPPPRGPMGRRRWGSPAPAPRPDRAMRMARASRERAEAAARAPPTRKKSPPPIDMAEQLTPFEQQQVKPRTPEVLATWPGHDYHGKFLPNRIEELEAELRALQEQAAELADDVVEPLGQQLGRSTAALSAS